MNKDLVFKISKALGLYPKEQEKLEYQMEHDEYYGWLEALAKNNNIDEETFKDFEKECGELPLSKKAYLLFNNEGVEVRIYNYIKDESTGELLGYKVCFEWYSDAGEDIVDETDLPLNFTDEDLMNFYDGLWINFDVDDHVEPLVDMRGTRGVPSSIKTLVDDAESIQEKYHNIYNQLFDLI